MKKNNTWKGYDMEQIRILRATTALRIDIEKERIKNIFSADSHSNEKARNVFASATDIVGAAEYGIKTYKIVKKVTNLFHKKKK
ncbi:MAG: hypothetical protein K2L55_08810 [Muribaculaceae bacterium]|nr:hypothetical protein [Muribaculaceae bacterium]